MLGYGTCWTTLPDKTTMVETFPQLEPREFRLFDRFGMNFPPETNALLS